ncbi:hypothetical protein C2E23DRAFT_855798, partial [Lenzites betulinus]
MALRGEAPWVWLDYLGESAQNAAGALRDVDKDVQDGTRNELGVKRKADDDLRNADACAKFDRTMDSTKEICDRAQSYHKSISTIFDLMQKWIGRSLDVAGDVNRATSLDAFIDDPTPEKHLINGIRGLRTFTERLAGHKSFNTFFGALAFRYPAVRSWFDAFVAHLCKILDEKGYAHSDKAKKTGERLRLARRAHSKLGEDLENGLIVASSAGAQSLMERAPWFWQDVFNVYLRKFVGMVKDIPISRTEYKDDEVEFVLEDLNISTFSLLPGHAYIRNITDVDITAPAGGKADTAVDALTRVYFQGPQMQLKGVSFYYYDKTAPVRMTGWVPYWAPIPGVLWSGLVFGLGVLVGMVEG